MKPLASLLSLALLASPAALSSQAMETPISPGTRVRVTAPEVLGRRLSGDVLRMGVDTLVLARGDEELAIPLDAVRRIEVSAGRDHLRGLLWGVGIGAVAGAAAGGISCTQWEECDRVEAGPLILATVTGAVGAGVGGLVGLARGTERWTSIREADAWPVSVAPSPGGGVAVGVGVRF